MEKEGYVSLWIGNMKVDDELLEYVELRYTDEGEWEPSKFMIDFNIDIDDFDEDYIERVYHETVVNSVSELIAGCSYDNIIIPKIEKVLGKNFSADINSAILLYNYDYDEMAKRVNVSQCKFEYVCSVEYHKF